MHFLFHHQFFFFSSFSHFSSPFQCRCIIRYRWNQPIAKIEMVSFLFCILCFGTIFQFASEFQSFLSVFPCFDYIFCILYATSFGDGDGNGYVVVAIENIAVASRCCIFISMAIDKSSPFGKLWNISIKCAIRNSVIAYFSIVFRILLHQSMYNWHVEKLKVFKRFLSSPFYFFYIFIFGDDGFGSKNQMYYNWFICYLSNIFVCLFHFPS